MDELISRAALLADIERDIEKSGCVNHEREIMDCIRYAPTVPAELVRHGRWEYREELQYFTIIEMMDCSVCGEHQNPEQVEAWAYCPNCGARMDLDPAMEKEDSK